MNLYSLLRQLPRIAVVILRNRKLQFLFQFNEIKKYIKVKAKNHCKRKNNFDAVKARIV